jgi:enamine deaminase RidA (YjgF/YER057c/UK114 family)
MAITRFINPSTMSKPIGFAHVVDITGPGRTIYIAGQLGIDTDGKVAGSLREQVAQALRTSEKRSLRWARVSRTSSS